VWNQFLSSTGWGWINRWINGDGSKTYGNDHWNNHIRFRWLSMATSYLMCIYPIARLLFQGQIGQQNDDQW
jgi:hypothetical protein